TSTWTSSLVRPGRSARITSRSPRWKTSTWGDQVARSSPPPRGASPRRPPKGQAVSRPRPTPKSSKTRSISSAKRRRTVKGSPPHRAGADDSRRATSVPRPLGRPLVRDSVSFPWGVVDSFFLSFSLLIAVLLVPELQGAARGRDRGGRQVQDRGSVF